MIKIALSTALCAVLASASTTMCFKKDHMDPSNIETTPLDGGACQGKLTVADMKKQGYDISDIKITVGQNGMDYMYIFKKETVVIGSPSIQQQQTGTQVLTKEQLRGYLEDLKAEDEAEELAKQKIINIEQGKSIYNSKCLSCHGINADDSTYSTARPLNTLSQAEFLRKLNQYSLGMVNSPNAFIMNPMAESITANEARAIFNYINSL